MINETLTETSVILTCKRGFNGGLQQDFVLLYKQAFGSVWKEIFPVADTEKHINFTLSGLVSGTDYQTRVYSRNAIGNSPLSEIVTFKTRPSIEGCFFFFIFFLI